MSPGENKAVIRRAYEEIWNERNVESVDDLVTEDFLNHAAPPTASEAARASKTSFARSRAPFQTSATKSKT